MKRMIVLIIIIMAISAGSQRPQNVNEIGTIVAQTLAAQSTAISQPEPSNIPDIPSTNTTNPTNTPYTPQPTDTIEPTFTSTPTQGLDTSRVVAKNYVATQDNRGVVIEIARILIADKSAIPDGFKEMSLFDDKPTFVEFIIRVTNNTDKVINLYANQGVAAINGEQIDMAEYMIEGAIFGDRLGGEFLPGVTAIGGIWIGVKRTPWNEINKIILKIHRPFDNDYIIEPDYLFDIDVVDWTFEPMPEELK